MPLNMELLPQDLSHELMVLDLYHHLCESLVRFPLFDQSHAECLDGLVLPADFISVLDHLLFQGVYLDLLLVDSCLESKLHIGDLVLMKALISELPCEFLHLQLNSLGFNFLKLKSLVSLNYSLFQILLALFHRLQLLSKVSGNVLYRLNLLVFVQSISLLLLYGHQHLSYPLLIVHYHI